VDETQGGYEVQAAPGLVQAATGCATFIPVLCADPRATTSLLLLTLMPVSCGCATSQAIDPSDERRSADMTQHDDSCLHAGLR